jgi:hypothetical protein
VVPPAVSSRFNQLGEGIAEEGIVQLQLKVLEKDYLSPEPHRRACTGLCRNQRENCNRRTALISGPL